MFTDVAASAPGSGRPDGRSCAPAPVGDAVIERCPRDDRARHEAAEILALGLAENPLFPWLFEGPRREAWTQWFATWAVRRCAAVGGLWVAGDTPRVGAFGYFPPGRGGSLDSLRTMPRWPGLPPRRAWTEGRRLEADIARLRPRGPHFHLFTVAIRKEARGRGLWGAFIGRLTADADTRRVPIHLETSSTANVERFARSGFAVVGEARVGASPIVWVMHRAPRP